LQYLLQGFNPHGQQLQQVLNLLDLLVQKYNKLTQKALKKKKAKPAAL
jgi:hypothetical protein